MATRRRIKLKPYDMRLAKNRGGFIMTISASTKTNADYDIEIDFEDWWIKHIHEKLATLVDEKANDIAAIQALFRKQEPPF